MGGSKCLRVDTGLYGSFAGIMDDHGYTSAWIGAFSKIRMQKADASADVKVFQLESF